MRRARGNILVMALFVSVFLYFLSVALVAQNRQDVLLSVTREHRARADAAARAGLELALHVMRTDAAWPQRLEGAHGELETGGAWSLQPPAPVPGHPNLLEIRSEGVSGIARVTRRRIVEEVALASPDCPGPHLFALTGEGELAMLAPDFRWIRLGPAPDPQSWLVASGGPLFSHVDGPADAPPRIFDLTPRGMEEVPLVVQPSRTVAWLDLGPETASWKEIPSPDQVGGNLFRQVDSEIRGTRYQGPGVEWYTLTGRALVAQGTVVVSHARHEFYRGARATVTATGYVLDEPGRHFSSSALLAHDLASGDWSVLVDLMRVSDLQADPEIHVGSRSADVDTLGLVGSQPYALEAGNPRAVLRGMSSGWTLDRQSSGLSRGLYAYAGRLRMHTSEGSSDGMPRISLSEGLDPGRDLVMDRPGVRGALWDASTRSFQERDLIPPKRLRANLLGDLTCTESFQGGGGNDGANCVAIQGSDLYTFVRLRTEYLAEPDVEYLPPWTEEFLKDSARTETVALARFDGQRWQVWPGGLAEFSALPTPPHSTLVEVGDLQLSPRSLAAASYPEGTSPPRKRYAPVVDL